MARVSTMINFARSTEQAFNFYKSIFGGDFSGPIMRFGDIPSDPAHPMADADKSLIAHIELPILGGHILMGNDVSDSDRFTLNAGNNFYISLQPDDRKETDRLFHALSDGGKVEISLAEMFWGDYFGTLADRFGIQWMFICPIKK